MSASAVISDSAFAAGIRFEELCGVLESQGYETRLRQAALDALGVDWSARYLPAADRWVIEHRSRRIRVEVLAEAIVVEESDRFTFEVSEVRFGGRDRRAYGPRALRYAAELVREVVR